MEWTLQQQGFDYTYDKLFCTKSPARAARPPRAWTFPGADMAYQDRLARFLENHDEPRAASTFAPEVHAAAAVLTFLSPALRFFHQGSSKDARIRSSPHLVRAPDEATDAALQQFYERLLAVLRLPIVREGNWSLLDCVPAYRQPDGGQLHCFPLVRRRAATGARGRRTVRLRQSQCFVHSALPADGGPLLAATGSA